jgi:hypothetical protein
MCIELWHKSRLINTRKRLRISMIAWVDRYSGSSGMTEATPQLLDSNM